MPKDIQELLENRVKTFNNMAQVQNKVCGTASLGDPVQAQMKLNAFDSAMASVRQVQCYLGNLVLDQVFQVLKIQPNNEKALFRKAKILQEKCHVEEAIGGSSPGEPSVEHLFLSGT